MKYIIILSVIIKETKRGCVRSVSSFVSFVVSHSTSKITDKELRRGRVFYKAVRWGEGSEKNIFAENIFGENIFAENIFGENIFAKYFCPKYFCQKKIH